MAVIVHAQIRAGEITEADQNMIRELAATIREQLEEPCFKGKWAIMSLLEVQVKFWN